MAKYCVMAGWDDVPHLDKKTRDTLYAAIPPYQRDARSKGIPQLGSGAIYPIPESDITVKDFQLPTHWPRGFGFDVGWNRTAGIFAALNRDDDILYLYSEHYRGEAEPAVHAAAMRARGPWIPGRIDPAARGRSQKDGDQLLYDYQNLGMDVMPAINAVESGIYKVWMRASTGRLKVFESCQNWFSEFRIYRRDEKGKIVKVNDHLMDACIAPGTIVITDSGDIPIEKLVGHNGKVLSRCGSWLNFTGARLTMTDVSVVKMSFSDGSTITCTQDHKFLTVDGWVEAMDMAGIDCYNGVTQCNRIKSYFQSLYQAPFRNLKAFATIFVENTFSVMASGFTEKCIKKTTEIYRKGMMFTTKMKTEATIILKTLSFLPGRNISAFTSEGIPEVYLRPLYQKQRYGTRAKQVLSGIKSIIRKLPISYMKKLSLFVSTAVTSTLQKLQERIDFVATTVRVRRVRRLVLTMKNAIAWFVAECLWLIVTLKNKHAQKSALVRCLSVTDAGKSDVYCLTVPAASSFCIESGIVVHNTRYLVQECETNDFMITKPIKQNTRHLATPVVDDIVNY